MLAASARTGALLGCACALGELLATGDEQRIELMRAFGQRLGLVAEHVDDDEASRQLAAARRVLRRAGARTNGRASDELATLATLVRTRER